MKKKSILFLIAIISSITALGCPACEKQQPELLRGITHGTGPQSDWDYFIIWTVAFIVLVTLILSIKYVFWPGEKSSEHIKRTVLKF